MTGRVPRAPTSQAAAVPAAAPPATFPPVLAPRTSTTAPVASPPPALPHFVHPSRIAARASDSVTLHSAAPATLAVSGRPPVPSTELLLQFLAGAAARHGDSVPPAETASAHSMTRPVMVPSVRPLTSSAVTPAAATFAHAPVDSPRSTAIASGVIHSDRIAQVDLTLAQNLEAAGSSAQPRPSYRWTPADRIPGRHASRSRSRESESQRYSNRHTNHHVHTQHHWRPAHQQQQAPLPSPKATPRHRGNHRNRDRRSAGFDDSG